MGADLCGCWTESEGRSNRSPVEGVWESVCVCVCVNVTSLLKNEKHYTLYLYKGKFIHVSAGHGLTWNHLLLICTVISEVSGQR